MLRRLFAILLTVPLLFSLAVGPLPAAAAALDTNTISVENIKISVVTDPTEIAKAEKLCAQTAGKDTVLLKLVVYARNNFPFSVYNPAFFIDYHVFSNKVPYLYGQEKDCIVTWMEANSDTEAVKSGQPFTATAYDFIDDANYLCESVSVSYISYAEKRNSQDTTGFIPTRTVKFSFKDYKDTYSGFKTAPSSPLLSILSENRLCAGEYHSVYIKDDGTVAAVGRTKDGRCNVSKWKDIVAVSAYNHTVGLKSDGTVVATGANGSKQCNVSKWKNIVAIDAGLKHTLGVQKDGTVVAVGNNKSGQCDVSTWKNIVQVAAGDKNSYGLKKDGTVVAAGSNSNKQKNLSSWEDICQIDAGSLHVVGLREDGTVVAAGSNGYGQCNVEKWKDIVAVSAGFYFTLGLKADGTVVSTGDDRMKQCKTKKWEDIVAIAGGTYHSVGMTEDGKFYTAGSNAHGQRDLK